MASCAYCTPDRRGNHQPGCPNAPGGGGGGGGKEKKKKKVEKHAHQWVWRRRGGGKLGGYYDEYYCSFPGCPATKDVPV